MNWLEAHGITPEQFYDIVTFPLAQCEASLICSNLITRIQKNGGRRSRDAGVKLLKRIRQRYTDEFIKRCAEIKS